MSRAESIVVPGMPWSVRRSLLRDITASAAGDRALQVKTSRSIMALVEKAWTERAGDLGWLVVTGPRRIPFFHIHMQMARGGYNLIFEPRAVLGGGFAGEGPRSPPDGRRRDVVVHQHPPGEVFRLSGDPVDGHSGILALFTDVVVTQFLSAALAQARRARRGDGAADADLRHDRMLLPILCPPLALHGFTPISPQLGVVQRAGLCDLSAFISGRQATQQQLLFSVLALASFSEAAWDACRFVHGDLRPCNVVICQDPPLKGVRVGGGEGVALGAVRPIAVIDFGSGALDLPGGGRLHFDEWRSTILEGLAPAEAEHEEDVAFFLLNLRFVISCVDEAAERSFPVLWRLFDAMLAEDEEEDDEGEGDFELLKRRARRLASTHPGRFRLRTLLDVLRPFRKMDPRSDGAAFFSV